MSRNRGGSGEEVRGELNLIKNFLGMHVNFLQISTLEQRLGLTVMTRVQQLTIPVILKNNDVLVKSQTGSGINLCPNVSIKYPYSLIFSNALSLSHTYK